MSPNIILSIPVHDDRTHELLRDLLIETTTTNRILRRIEHILRQNQHPNVTSFAISPKESSMLPIAPGFSPQFTATVLPAGTVLNPAQPVPTWTSSDTTNAPVTVDSTGLIATVAVPATAVVGTAFTLSISYTNADGTVAAGSASFTIVAAPPTDVSGFTIAQSA